MINDDICYRFEEYKYTDGLLNDSVDATYILHLEDNGRLESIKKQLNQYHPTNIVYIVFDKGYKKCKKQLKEDNALYDIVNSYSKIFEHSAQHNFSNVLVLEDDFIFGSELHNKFHIETINSFMNTHKNEELIYSLGVIPLITYPYNLYTYRILIAGGLHASIYTRKAQDNIIKNFKNIGFPEVYIASHIKWYMYYIPLVYQLFPQTDNSKNWPFIWPFDIIARECIKLVNLEKNMEPGTSIMYILSKILFLAFIFYIMYIMITIYTTITSVVPKKYNTKKK
jgi:hypothetical protein